MRLIPLLKTLGVSVKRGRQKGPARYTVQMKNATFGPVTLLELEDMARRLASDGTSPDQA